MELVLVPFVLPLLLLGRLLELLEAHRPPRPGVIDEGAWRRTWFVFHGRPRIADRKRDQDAGVSDGA